MASDLSPTSALRIHSSAPASSGLTTTCPLTINGEEFEITYEKGGVAIPVPADQLKKAARMAEQFLGSLRPDITQGTSDMYLNFKSRQFDNLTCFRDRTRSGFYNKADFSGMEPSLIENLERRVTLIEQWRKRDSEETERSVESSLARSERSAGTELTRTPARTDLASVSLSTPATFTRADSSRRLDSRTPVTATSLSMPSISPSLSGDRRRDRINSAKELSLIDCTKDQEFIPVFKVLQNAQRKDSSEYAKWVEAMQKAIAVKFSEQSKHKQEEMAKSFVRSLNETMPTDVETREAMRDILCGMIEADDGFQLFSQEDIEQLRPAMLAHYPAEAREDRPAVSLAPAATPRRERPSALSSLAEEPVVSPRKPASRERESRLASLLADTRSVAAVPSRTPRSMPSMPLSFIPDEGAPKKARIERRSVLADLVENDAASPKSAPVKQERPSLVASLLVPSEVAPTTPRIRPSVLSLDTEEVDLSHAFDRVASDDAAGDAVFAIKPQRRIVRKPVVNRPSSPMIQTTDSLRQRKRVSE